MELDQFKWRRVHEFGIWEQSECLFQYRGKLIKQGVLKELIAHDTDLIENDASNNSYIFACVFIAAVKFYRTVA
jgi:hypothetical protein